MAWRVEWTPSVTDTPQKRSDLFVFQVAWVRVDTQTILTIHNNVITRNPRISLSRPSNNQVPLKGNFRLTLGGWNACFPTHPPISGVVLLL